MCFVSQYLRYQNKYEIRNSYSSFLALLGKLLLLHA